MSLKKIEIGVGDNPQKEGWIHQDIRPLPNVDMVCDATKLPLDDNSMEDLFASHVIEHFSWRITRDVLKEWVRVLKTGGKMELITPDFFRLWENLITKRELPTTDKWKGGPVDSAFVAYVTGGGQDYPENTHIAHYTHDWYKKTLEELGCQVVVRFHGQEHPSPSIRIIAIKL